jgi:hypothetical protein
MSVIAAMVLSLVAFFVWEEESQLAGVSASTPLTSRRLTSSQATTITTTTVTIHGYLQNHPIARKQRQDLEYISSSETTRFSVQFRSLSEQREFVKSTCSEAALQQFDALMQAKLEHLAVELYKWCALSTVSKNNKGAAAFVDSSSPLVTRLQAMITDDASLAILGDGYFSKTIHGSLIVLQPSQAHIAKEMLSVLVETPVSVLRTSPLLIPRTLYALIAVDVKQTLLTPGKMANRGSCWSSLVIWIH